MTSAENKSLRNGYIGYLFCYLLDRLKAQKVFQLYVVIILKQVQVNEERGNFLELLAPKWRHTTLLLFVLWFTSGFGYYGIILLTTSMMQMKVDGCRPYGATLAHNTVNTTNLTQRVVCTELTNRVGLLGGYRVPRKNSWILVYEPFLAYLGIWDYHFQSGSR